MASFFTIIYLNILKYGLSFLRFFLHLFLRLIHVGQKQVVPDVEDPLLFKSATNLAQLIRDGQILSETVVLSYIKRIREIQPLINAVAEDRFGDALEEAKNVDNFIASKSKSKEEIEEETPLLGVPVTVKLIIEVKGMHANAASKYFEHRKANNDAKIVALMRKAGAIILATTNAPEFSICLDTKNKIYGLTRNPYDTTRSAGGSSGGEAALIGSAGSILGLGNDLGGSIRLPASWCGIFGHKPTEGLVSLDGTFPESSPLTKHLISQGPMCRYAEDLSTALKILVGSKRDSLKMEDPVDISGIKIYYMQGLDDNVVAESVDATTLLYQLKAVLHLEEKCGTKAKNVEVGCLKFAFWCWICQLTLSMKNSIREFLMGENTEFNPKMEMMKWFFGRAKYELNTIGILLFEGIVKRSALRATAQIEKYCAVFEEKIASLLDENSILLVPTATRGPCYSEEVPFVQIGCEFLTVFNLLGLPVTQCPLGIDENGLPIGIQIVASKGNDRLAIACAIELEKHFGGWTPPWKQHY